MATSLALPAMRSCGHTLDEGEDKLGLLTSTHDALANMDLARERMEQDNYLLLRGLLDKEDVLAARRHILEQLALKSSSTPARP
jgi:ribosomal protein L4